MPAPNLQSTAILTEHLEYPPISLLDEIINNVNDIMYKCTAAMEKYLLRKSNIEGIDYSEEIRVGIAKLETLLEHTVDKNFDKLELYVLRNVLMIPQELLESNVFLLKHQSGLDIDWLSHDKDISNDPELFKEKMIEFETKLLRNQLLRDRIKQVKRLQTEVKKFKLFIEKSLNELINNNDEGINNNVPFKDMFQSLRPIDDSMGFLISQLKQLYTESEDNCSTQLVQSVLDDNKSKNSNSIGDKNHKTLLSRAQYIETVANSVLESRSNVSKTNDRQIFTNNNINNIQIEDPDLSLFNEL
ncbi:similar to Saccharomyces cerevisiae YAL034W-A MTW1 Essential component of the MIND kinetochore complex (Mtw1p Including Nnf1p-Nsl1p-Dsn1p) [Maudiozyma saulgeensis]|uniref:Similar to Saccharomyces cerevisiae YAL034W-A MTW1 Essential component of the MIND kinetochore complex (Mtw1p Including Nnf1p-Nsl1p-Dsn1p) n=1 Tax=Maudiozyma saulgeensis TaxID=1789683 RepID=A0A1X7R762_9SACH|nr:similar to Saccharomyces cerevisiae YAL034W-A MTW1 Essential component of the MIND kinetochore complex (Mtw1p Including Nnf1p-Nsl1p-Dsn1p) [Kazachstania saulgeensis]